MTYVTEPSLHPQKGGYVERFMSSQHEVYLVLTHTAENVLWSICCCPKYFSQYEFPRVATSFTLQLLMSDASRLHRSDSPHLFDPNTFQIDVNREACWCWTQACGAKPSAGFFTCCNCKHHYSESQVDSNYCTRRIRYLVFRLWIGSMAVKKRKDLKGHCRKV